MHYAQNHFTYYKQKYIPLSAKMKGHKTMDFRKGIKDGIPIALGYFSVSIAFGLMASEAGYT